MTWRNTKNEGLTLRIKRKPAVDFATPGLSLTKAEGGFLLHVLELHLQDIDDLPKRI